MTEAEPASPAILAVVDARRRDLGDGFTVRRLLPAAAHRAVGPFVFFDHFGPTRIPPAPGLNVRPHPHINLATVTYLFDGEIVHRDSLGSHEVIRPGDINWMTAGRGIVHSERSDPARLGGGGPGAAPDGRLHGLQLWVALPREHEETAPEFHHHPAATLPSFTQGGAEIRLLVGEAWGRRSPVRTFSRLVYLDVRMNAGAELEVPPDQGDRAVYPIEGSVECEGRSYAASRMLLLRAGRAIRLHAPDAARLVLIGGDPLGEPRHVWWNFVSSSAERIEQAKRDWRDRRGDPQGPFPLVPGDDREFIPLPEG
jgi:redox-sensitive bicupin YhaK (pirin superfamily)